MINENTKKINKEYMLWFVEEAIYDPKYKDWAGGRMEVHKPDKSPYSIDEIRFFTPRSDEWKKFRNEYDGKDVDKIELDKVTKTIKENFYQIYKEG
ncbi:MAG: hypothetical protein KKD94_01780 [Nanoarchaeota archaeon]|nr:hypothetical protein [Nanoarchaeota archaeon]